MIKSEVIVIDLKHQEQPNSIASFLVPYEDGLILIESGPHSTYENLKAGIENAGFQIDDVKYVLLTHIHLDHAGAAWALAQVGAHVYVHTLGYRHLQDPSRLMESARIIYQDQMDALWGEMKEIHPDRLHAVEDEDLIAIGSLKAKVIYTPGHAKHHVAWRIGNKIFTGDVAGARIHLGPLTPPCPPPDIDIELWMKSIDRLLKEEGVDAYYLTHFGKINDIQYHMAALRKALKDYADFLLPYFKNKIEIEQATSDFVEFVHNKYEEANLTPEEIESYQAANPAEMSVAGIMRYWSKKSKS